MQTSLRGVCAVGFSLAVWLIVLLAILIDGDLEDDSSGVLLTLWFVSGLGALVSGVWALVAPKGPRDPTLGLLALGIFASQFLVAFMIGVARG